MLKIKCDIDQQYLKTVDLYCVKSEQFSLPWSCGSRQLDTTSSGWKCRLNNLAVKLLMPFGAVCTIASAAMNRMSTIPRIWKYDKCTLQINLEWFFWIIIMKKWSTDCQILVIHTVDTSLFTPKQSMHNPHNSSSTIEMQLYGTLCHTIILILSSSLDISNEHIRQVIRLKRNCVDNINVIETKSSSAVQTMYKMFGEDIDRAAERIYSRWHGRLKNITSHEH